MRKALSALVILILAATLTATPVRAEPVTERLLEVQLGDNLWRIAETTGTEVADWLKTNPHLETNPGYIQCGWQLNIPQGASFNYLDSAGTAFLPWRTGEVGGHYGVLQSFIWTTDP